VTQFGYTQYYKVISVLQRVGLGIRE